MADQLMLYGLARSDLPSMPLGGGKMAAQLMHAANAFAYRHAIVPLLNGQPLRPDVRDWHAEARATPTDISNGFGTSITLEVPSLDRLRAVVSTTARLGFCADLVTDKEYPYEVSEEIMRLLPESLHTQPPIKTRGAWMCFRKEVTCGYVFGLKDDLSVILRQFDLMPNSPRG